MATVAYVFFFILLVEVSNQWVDGSLESGVKDSHSHVLSGEMCAVMKRLFCGVLMVFSTLGQMKDDAAPHHELVHFWIACFLLSSTLYNYFSCVFTNPGSTLDADQEVSGFAVSELAFRSGGKSRKG